MATGQNFNFQFSFVMPTDQVMEIARTHVDSANEDYRSVAKALLDTTEEATKVKDCIEKDIDVDVAPYLDFWFADAVECAKRLLDSGDHDAGLLAHCLIDAEKATIKSKENMLAEIKRLGLKRRD